MAIAPDDQRRLIAAYRRMQAAAAEAERATSELWLAVDTLRLNGHLDPDFWEGADAT